MSLSIRERSQKVAAYLKENAMTGIGAMAAALDISKSSVHRHQQGILRRQQYPGSEWWETAAGSGWLKLLVLGVVYYFGIKQGVGSESLSEFLQAMRLEQQVGSERECVADVETADEASHC